MIRAFLAALAVLAGGMASGAELSGRLEQGGLVVGRAPPGAAVTLDGKPVPVASDGRFVLGFGRDQGARAALTIGGRAETLAIARRDWPVQRVDGLPPAKVTPDPAQLERIRAENALIAERRAAVTPVAAFATGFALPADGPRSGVFGSQRILNGEPRAPHSGLDIAAPEGSAVRAAADGRVSLAAPDLFFTGQTLMIDHGLGVQTVYAHLSRIDVSEGQTVSRGQTIGAVGHSGRATGAHLHWGVTWLDVKLDPETAMAVLGP